MSTCAVGNCEKSTRSRGLCSKHYNRWIRHGDPLLVKKIRDGEPARFRAFVDQTETCWLWTGALNNSGYPRFKTSLGEYAHRWSYIHHKGMIPTGYVVDHLCRTPRCVNPDHLEAVTPLENILRGVGSHAGNGLCKKGHDVTDPDNPPLVRPGRGRDGGVTYYCRTCWVSRAAS